MSFDLSTISVSQFVWIVLAVLAIIGVFVIVRFFFHHILKFLIQGCVVLVAIAALLALLHYFGVF